MKKNYQELLKTDIFLTHMFSYTRNLKKNVSNRFLSKKTSFDFVFSRGEFIKVILKSNIWCEMFVFKLSGIQNIIMF